MLMQFGSVSAFKAYLPSWEPHSLDFERLRHNMQAGVQTQLILDANILIDMEACCAPDMPADNTTLERFHLLEWVTFLRECNRQGLSYHLSPFFALQELPIEKVEGAAQAIDEFPRKFGLAWLDDLAALSPELASVGRRASRGRYEAMRDPDRRFFSLNYAALLLMLVVARDSVHCPPYVKFAHYLRLYRRRVDVVSMRAMSIARMVFAPPPDGSVLYIAWDRVVRNFTDRKSVTKPLPRSLHAMDRAALNGAYDLMLLDAALVAEAKGVGSEPVDPWIVSKDKKLASMGEIIRHAGPHKGQAGQYVEMTSFAHLGGYWARTEEALSKLGSRARVDMRVDWDGMERRARGVVALAANGLYGIVDQSWYQNTTTLRCAKDHSGEPSEPEAPFPVVYRA